MLLLLILKDWVVAKAFAFGLLTVFADGVLFVALQESDRMV